MKNFYSVEERYVVDLFNNAREGYDVLYTLETASEDIRCMREEGWEVPEELTPDTLMRVWNDMVLSTHERVVLPGDLNEREVPRYTAMTDLQIAEVVNDAEDWSEVADLVEYIDREYLHLSKTESGYYEAGWDQIVTDWCDDQINK